MHVSDDLLSRWIENYEAMGVPAPEITYDLRDARAALWRIAGNGDVLAGIHIVDPGDGLGACNFECEWWCIDHQRCAEVRECLPFDDDGMECGFAQHVHCVDECPTRIALEALANEGEGT